MIPLDFAFRFPAQCALTTIQEGTAPVDTNTQHALNAINRQFYAATAADFDQTRGEAWPGWKRLVQHLPSPPLTVLDLGCGNGRFGVFLAEALRQHSAALRYHGIDNNPTLLGFARLALQNAGLAFTLEQRDLIESLPEAGRYDLVVLFGVIHHVPGYEARLALMQRLAQLVAPGGILAFASWRFYEVERFRQRIVSWQHSDHSTLAVEPHDYLLDWRRGTVALRYCHYVDDAEHSALVEAAGLHEVITYRADGLEGSLNCYSILKGR